MNVKPGPFNFVSWWMSYLNFQIEHHLFPSMPQFRQPLVSQRVKKLFEKHKLVYDQRSYTEAMKVTFQNLHKVGSDVFLG
jgi:fatty acid desaturase 2 (delta-6 desaturase)